jgi:hypothetical protein
LGTETESRDRTVTDGLAETVAKKLAIKEKTRKKKVRRSVSKGGGMKNTKTSADIKKADSINGPVWPQEFVP